MNSLKLKIVKSLKNIKHRKNKKKNLKSNWNTRKNGLEKLVSILINLKNNSSLAPIAP